MPIELAPWSQALLRRARYKVIYGGRGSGKTHAVAQLLVLRAATQPVRIACVREYQKSIQESAKQTIEHYIRASDLAGQFDVQRDYIHCANGSSFFFRGMSTATEESIRGWEGVDIVWVEEAQRMTERSREILYPTIRKPGSELWFTFNPRNRYDPVYRDFCAGSAREANAAIIKTNYDSNPWFPPELETERQICLADEPDRYAHIWLGEPDDEAGVQKVLPYSWLQQCVEAYPLWAESGRTYVGLDVADSDGGGDKNAVAVRRGAALLHAEAWPSSDQGATTRKADTLCREHNATALYYDHQGVGAGVKTYLDIITDREYIARGIGFGEGVAGRDSQYQHGTTNGEFFSRRNAQLAWTLRGRANNTRRLLRGEDVSLDKCLFISPDIPRLEGILAQMSQPIRKEDIAGRIVVDKAPDDAPSPDIYDAVALAFAWDSRHGLQAD